MTNKDIIRTAMRQSAIDSSCDEADFSECENKIVISQKNDHARKYLKLPFDCDLTSYGSNIVASVTPQTAEIVCEYISKFSTEGCFETPHIHLLEERLKPLDLSVCFMAEYFLPDINILKPLSCGYETKIMEKDEFSELYLPQWSNALCESRKQNDVLAVGAFDKGALIGMAGCSADCDTMWQIGIDVLPPYRREGVAACLTSTLAAEVLKRDIVPFYCCAWSNIGSAKNAIKSGFRPAWVQLTVKSSEAVKEMNA